MHEIRFCKLQINSASLFPQSWNKIIHHFDIKGSKLIKEARQNRKILEVLIFLCTLEQNTGCSFLSCPSLFCSLKAERFNSFGLSAEQTAKLRLILSNVGFNVASQSFSAKRGVSTSSSQTDVENLWKWVPLLSKEHNVQGMQRRMKETFSLNVPI